jgi:hypothetical protein
MNHVGKRLSAKTEFCKPDPIYASAFDYENSTSTETVDRKQEAADGEEFEPDSLTACAANSLPQSPNQGEAESEAVCHDSDLKAVVDGWSALPEAIKAGILAMVRAAK